MSVSFDTNVLVYATATLPSSKSVRARELIARAMRAGSSVLLLQSLAEFSNVAIRKAGIKVEAVQAIVAAWEAVLPVEAAHREDLPAALDAVKAHKLAFWDAMLWATACRIGVHHMLTEDLQDGFQLHGVKFVNPFKGANDALIDAILPP
jgi:predicted nucleic acid-binding protein